MRKTGLIILMTAAALSMSACGRNEKPESTKPSGTVAAEKETVKKTEKATEKKTEAQTEEQTEKETETKETLSESESEAAATDENVLQLDAELSELLDKMYAIKGPDFDVETDTVDFDDEYAVSSYTGLTMDDVKKLDAAIVSEPMMGSQAYSLVLVRLKDKADAADIAQKMADGINPRKWVCVEADELTVVSKDNIIMLFMAKVQKPWALFILGMISPIIMLLGGHTYVVVLHSLVVMFIAEMIRRAGGFKSLKFYMLAFMVFNTWICGSLMQMLLAREKYIELSMMMGKEYVDALIELITYPHMALVYAGALIGGLIGAYIGKILLKKHFTKAGIA